MREQAITYSSMDKNIYKSDFYKYPYLQDKNAKDEAVCESLRIAKNFNDYKFNIRTIDTSDMDKNGNLKKKNFLYVFPEKLLIRKCAKNISKILSGKKQDRNKAIRELKSCIKWGGEQKIYKIDIASYYESLEKEYIRKLLSDNPRISSHTKNIIFKLLEQYWLLGGVGLPRGIEISNPIANLALEELDNAIKNHPDCLYYSRFVDDILIVSNSINGKGIQQSFKEKLPAGLFLNTAKTATISNDKTNSQFTYLGCEISVEGIKKCKRDGYREIGVTHSLSKIKSIKDKIFKSFLDYSKESNFSLLFDRLQYLSTNRSFKLGRGKYKSGIYYSSSEIDNEEGLLDVDNYLYAFIKNNGIYHLKGKCKLTNEQKKKLKKINFKAGFISKYHQNLSYRRTQEVIKVWRF